MVVPKTNLQWISHRLDTYTVASAYYFLPLPSKTTSSRVRSNIKQFTIIRGGVKHPILMTNLNYMIKQNVASTLV